MGCVKVYEKEKPVKKMVFEDKGCYTSERTQIHLQRDVQLAAYTTVAEYDRIPLIMPEHLVNEWIRPGAKPEKLLSEALTQMEFEKAV